MLRDNTPDIDLFGGILVQEYEPENKKVVGEPVNVFKGSGLMATEAPHIFKRNGYYYLLVAEGGTGYHHAVTLARSKNLFGSYEIHPENPILTAKGKNTRLQKAGHADFVKVTDKEWAMVYLTSRPVDDKCMLGRETAIQKIIWHDDDWPRTETNGDPQDIVPDFGLPDSPVQPEITNDNFDSPTLNSCWLTPRNYIGDWADLTSRPGNLRLHALPANLFHTEPVSFLARRIRHHKFTVETFMDFSPEKFLQHAGLVCYYDCSHWYYLSKYINHSNELVISIWIVDSNTNKHEQISETNIENRPVKLSVKCDSRNLQFYWAYENEELKPIGPKLDALVLSDDYVYGKQPGFTGAFTGISASDKFDSGSHADFDYFNYITKEL
jgi:xylan 1,4-beta-xylosidase